ncbi:MAG: hypothetical protein E7111_02015 [Bacteroidales bacterium]|nr:hypothetical protein [Bacteroidales bacterium]
MKRLTAILLVATAAISFYGCQHELNIPLEAIDVEFEIPSTIDLEPGTTTLDFQIKDGKAPEPDDLLILNGPRGQYYCQITELSDESFTIRLYDNFANGEHKITIQRGLATAYKGSSTINIEKYDDGVHAATGSTVYGRVSCDGEAISGVVISDGVKVVKTDENGIYQMKSDKKNGYVFISVPSGYQVPVDVVLPVMWYPLTLAATTPERADFELIRSKDQTNFKLLVFGDIHLANRNSDKKQFQYFLDDVKDYRSKNSGKLIYGLTLGDMTWDRYWIDNKFSFPEYKNLMKTLSGMPIYQTPGNHDHDIYQAGDFLTIKAYRKYLGPSYYSHNIGNIHFVALDNIHCMNPGENKQAVYDNNIVEEQLNWLREDLKHVDKNTPVIVSMHAPAHHNPMGTDKAETIRNNVANQLLDAFSGFKNVQLFTAHTHVIYHVTDRNITEHNAGAICATWWWSGKYYQGVNVCTSGAAGGYTIVDVNGTDITYKFKGTQMDENKQFYTFDRNQIALKASTYVPNANEANLAEWVARVGRWKNANSDNYVYINTWNWDHKWKIEVTEKETGKKLETEFMTDFSPLHLVAHSAKRLNGSGNPNFLTSDGCILHRVKASKANTTLIIKVTDRFGNTYTEEMKRPKEFSPEAYAAY